jgi:hypothetical protein
LRILIVLREVSSYDLQVGMSHELLKGEDAGAVTKHIERKRAPKSMQGRFGGELPQGGSPIQHQMQSDVSKALSLPGYEHSVLFITPMSKV